MDRTSIDLSEFERAVLDKFLAGDHPVLEVIRQQVQGARVTERDMTGVGFFIRFEIPRTAARASDTVDTIHLTDVVAEIHPLAHGAGFVLYVTNGALAALEGFSYDEPWPDSIRSYELSYAREDRRDLGELPHPSR